MKGHCVYRREEPCIYEDKRVYCGAGVLIIGINDQGKETELIFVYDNERKKYTEPGGQTNNHYHFSSSHTAREELFEESALYFVASLSTIKKLPYVDYPHTKDCYYRVHVLRIPSSLIDEAEYIHNYTELRDNPNFIPGECYRETSGMLRVPLTSITHSNANLHKRTCEILENLSTLLTLPKVIGRFQKEYIDWGNGNGLYHILCF
jgi:hypothetical protein